MMFYTCMTTSSMIFLYHLNVITLSGKYTHVFETIYEYMNRISKESLFTSHNQ